MHVSSVTPRVSTKGNTLLQNYPLAMVCQYYRCSIFIQQVFASITQSVHPMYTWPWCINHGECKNN